MKIDWGYFALGLGLGACIAAAAGPALAHSWCPGACCTAMSVNPEWGDCRPLEPHEVAQTPEGYVIIATGEIVPAETARRDAPDAQIHVCLRHDGRVRYVRGEPCFWAPMEGM